MKRSYFPSAEEAASHLGVPLLLATSSSVAVPRSATRLSAHAPDPIVGARLYHCLQIEPGARGAAIWVVSPGETNEQVPWAVGVAEHAARDGKVAYLVDLDRVPVLQIAVSGPGHPLPEAVLERLAPLGVRAAVGWASDLQGVRVVLPVETVPEGERIVSHGPWCLIVARTLPGSDEQTARIAGHVDAVLLAAGIRDHPAEELERTMEALRRSGANVIGLIAMGPVPAGDGSPLGRWEGHRVETPLQRREGGNAREGPQREAPERPGNDHLPDRPRDKGGSGKGNASGQRAEVTEGGVELGEPVIELVAGWERLRRRRRWGRLFAWLGLGLGIGLAAFWLLGPWDETPAVEETAGTGVVPGTGSEAAGDVEETELIAIGWADTFVVHVSSFRRRADAEREVAGLLAAGLDARIVPVLLEERGRWQRVVIGAFPDSMSAWTEASRLREEKLVSFAQVLGGAGLGGGRRVEDIR